MTTEAPATGFPDIIKPCPKCKSEDISIVGVLWIQVICNECSACGLPHSYGSRLDRYCEAISSWNSNIMGESYT